MGGKVLMEGEGVVLEALLGPLVDREDLLILTAFNEEEEFGQACKGMIESSRKSKLDPFYFQPHGVDHLGPFFRIVCLKLILDDYTSKPEGEQKAKWVLVTDPNDVLSNTSRLEIVQRLESINKDL